MENDLAFSVFCGSYKFNVEQRFLPARSDLRGLTTRMKAEPSGLN